MIRDLLAARAAGADERFEALARLTDSIIRSVADPLYRTEEQVAACDYAESIFRRLADQNGLVRVLLTRVDIATTQCHWRTAWQYAAEARRQASDARGRHLEVLARSGQLNALLWGPFPAEEGIAQSEAELRDAPGYERSRIEASVMSLHAMAGSAQLAREIAKRTKESLHERGMRGSLGSVGLRAWMIEMIAGDLEGAAREAESAIAILRGIGETGVLSTLAAMLAETRVRQGRLDEAEGASRTSEEAASIDDLASQIMWRSARGQVHAHRGHLESGESLAREAVKIAQRTDFTYLQATALEALSVVLSLADRPTDARAALEAARERYRAKGDRPTRPGSESCSRASPHEAPGPGPSRRMDDRPRLRAGCRDAARRHPAAAQPGAGRPAPRPRHQHGRDPGRALRLRAVVGAIPRGGSDLGALPGERLRRPRPGKRSLAARCAAPSRRPGRHRALGSRASSPSTCRGSAACSPPGC